MYGGKFWTGLLQAVLMSLAPCRSIVLGLELVATSFEAAPSYQIRQVDSLLRTFSPGMCETLAEGSYSISHTSNYYTSPLDSMNQRAHSIGFRSPDAAPTGALVIT